MRPVIVVPANGLAILFVILGAISFVIAGLSWVGQGAQRVFERIQESRQPPFEWPSIVLRPSYEPWTNMRDEARAAVTEIIHSAGITEYNGIKVTQGNIHVTAFDSSKNKTVEHDMWQLISDHRSPIIWVNELGATHRKLVREYYNQRERFWLRFSVAVVNPLIHQNVDLSSNNELHWHELIVSASFRLPEGTVRPPIGATPDEYNVPLEIDEYRIYIRPHSQKQHTTSRSNLRRYFAEIRAAREVPYVNAPWFDQLTSGAFDGDKCYSNTKKEICEVLAVKRVDLTSPVGPPKNPEANMPNAAK